MLGREFHATLRSPTFLYLHGQDKAQGDQNRIRTQADEKEGNCKKKKSKKIEKNLL